MTFVKKRTKVSFVQIMISAPLLFVNKKGKGKKAIHPRDSPPRLFAPRLSLPYPRSLSLSLSLTQTLN